MARLQFVCCLALLALGCGGGGDSEDSEALRPPAIAHCSDLSRGLCSDADTSVLEPTQVFALQALCFKESGLWATGTCPEENRVGTCSTVQSGVAVQVRYYAPRYSAAEAQVSCASAPTTTWTAN